MNNHSIILYSNSHESEQAVLMLLNHLSMEVDIAHSAAAVVNCFKANDAKVLLLCFDPLDDGLNNYTELFDENRVLALSSHRAIAICSEQEAATAARYCLEQRIDDYFIVDLASDQDRLQLIIKKSVAELKKEGDYRNCTSYLSMLEEQSKMLDNLVEGSFKDCQNIIDFSNSSYSALIQVYLKKLNDLISSIPEVDDQERIHRLAEIAEQLSQSCLDFLDRPAERLRENLLKYNSGWSDEKFKNYSRLSRKIHAPLSALNSLTSAKILIVDDDELYREILVAMLEAEDYTVLTAAGGEQALETLQHTAPDIIILDIDMPGINGIELLKLIRAQEQWDEVPILMLTGMVDDEILSQSIKAGANGFFAKQGSESEGFETIDSLFRDKGILQTRHKPAPIKLLLTEEQRQTITPLIIDDDIFMQEIIGSLLDSLGIQKWKAVAGAEQALQLLHSSEPYNLLILDLNMPGMDGIELLRHLAVRKYRGAIILISGYGSRLLKSVENLGNAHQLNLIGSLGKPITPLKLAELLNRVSLELVENQYLAPDTWVPSRAEMRRAIDADEFIFHYQPQIEMRTKKLSGVEALARWQHPQRGLMAPALFIDRAEKNGLIEDMTNKLLRIAIQQHIAWREAGHEIDISVNIATPILNNLEFPKFISALVDELGMKPEKLTLEITETGLIRSFTNALDVLNRLRLKGFRLSIDDFGTGDSSFIKLKQMPFDELKIDREFMHGATHDKHAHAIVDASVILSQEFNLALVAEGIENHEDWIFSQNAGCKVIQGYFMSRPLPANQLLAWLGKYQRTLDDL